MRRLGSIIGFICILALLSCERVRIKTYPVESYPKKPPAAETLPVETYPKEPRPAETYPVETYPPKPPPAEPLPIKSYDETISEWKSYQDLVRWMEKDFIVDMDRLKKFEGTLPLPRTPKETFRLKSGIYIDAATFVKETLNRINPTYKAQVVVIMMRPYGANHYVCSFRKEGKLFIMDYGTPYKALTGVHGPYNSLEVYKKFYENNLPVKRQVEAIRPLP